MCWRIGSVSSLLSLTVLEQWAEWRHQKGRAMSLALGLTQIANLGEHYIEVFLDSFKWNVVDT